MMIKVIIDNLRNSDPYIETIFTQGSCFKFHLFLASIFNDARPYINSDNDHVITQVGDQFWDITGEVSSAGFRPLESHDMPLVENWSFAKRSFLSLGECPNCDEPLLV